MKSFAPARFSPDPAASPKNRPPACLKEKEKEKEKAAADDDDILTSDNDPYR